MSNFNNNEPIIKQYATSSNLNSRIQLHQLFSTNKQGFSKWVFENYEIKENQTILELGCGNGTIWKSNMESLPQNTNLILSDISSGMLDTAKTNTNDIQNITYKVINAEKIPFSGNTFDIVIANHMLYHVPDLYKALSEISRVLKADGIFYATTIGNDNLKEIVEILHNFDERIDFAQTEIRDAFGLQSGEPKLRKHFDSVEVKRYEDGLHITEPKPLIDYIMSLQGIGNVHEIITEDRLNDFSDYIISLFEEEGYIDVAKEAGIFISQNPKIG